MNQLFGRTAHHRALLALAGVSLCVLSVLALVDGDTPIGLLLLTFGLLGVYSAGVGVSPPKRSDRIVWIIGSVGFLVTGVVSRNADEGGLAVLSFIIAGVILLTVFIGLVLSTFPNRR